MDEYNIISAGGIVGLMVVAWLVSADRRRMNWRAIIWGVVIQLALAALVFLTPRSRDVFLWLNDVVNSVLRAAEGRPEVRLRPTREGPLRAEGGR
ncbi:MAG: Na+ dependent nucleoside transporter N-terminal domain-containing protein [Planctomycetota bacterium]|jgi:nucleoside permease NupC